MQTPVDKTKRRTTEDARRPYSRQPFGAPYGNTSSYTPASDLSAAPFVPAAENYSPPAAEPVPADPPAVAPGGGSAGDWS